MGGHVVFVVHEYQPVTWLRDIDRWFMDEVLPHQAQHQTYARKLLRGGEEAEDIVQEAYARLFGLETWRRIDNPHAFTMRIIHNIAVERFRRAGVVVLGEEKCLDDMDPADDRPSPEAEAMGRSELQHVADTLETLPERCREAVHLRRIEGLSPGDVAEKMHISVSTVEKHLAKGMRLLTERLSAPVERQDSGRIERWAEWTVEGRIGEIH